MTKYNIQVIGIVQGPDRFEIMADNYQLTETGMIRFVKYKNPSDTSIFDTVAMYPICRTIVHSAIEIKQTN